MATYRSKEIIEAEQYDGSSASVERIMTMLGRTQGIMNTSDGYMLIDEFNIKKNWFVIKDDEFDEGWTFYSEEDFNLNYEKLD